jgi:hypothetical protein
MRVVDEGGEIALGIEHGSPPWQREKGIAAMKPRSQAHDPDRRQGVAETIMRGSGESAMAILPSRLVVRCSPPVR